MSCGVKMHLLHSMSSHMLANSEHKIEWFRGVGAGRQPSFRKGAGIDARRKQNHIMDEFMDPAAPDGIQWSAGLPRGDSCSPHAAHDYPFPPLGSPKWRWGDSSAANHMCAQHAGKEEGDLGGQPKQTASMEFADKEHAAHDEELMNMYQILTGNLFDELAQVAMVIDLDVKGIGWIWRRRTCGQSNNEKNA